MNIWEWYVTLRYKLGYVYSDKGLQLVKYTKINVNKDDSEYRSKIWNQDRTKHMLTGGMLMFPEFETLLCKAPDLING